MVRAWRIVKPEFADDAFSGEGAAVHGGRWNSRGNPVVYTASSLALATLELLVNVTKAHRLREYTAIPCSFDDALVRFVGPLPDDWTGYPAPPMVQTIGDSWLLSHTSAVLAVPSAIIQFELNYLLNPDHPGFRAIEIGKPMPFRLDYRLLT